MKILLQSAILNLPHSCLLISTYTRAGGRAVGGVTSNCCEILLGLSKKEVEIIRLNAIYLQAIFLSLLSKCWRLKELQKKIRAMGIFGCEIKFK